MGSQGVGHDWVTELNWMNTMVLNTGNLKDVNQNPKIFLNFLQSYLKKKNPLYFSFWVHEALNYFL